MHGRIDPPSSMHALTLAAVQDQEGTGEVWTIGSPPLAAVFLTPKPKSPYLGKLAVAADHRGRGLARVLSL